MQMFTQFVALQANLHTVAWTVLNVQIPSSSGHVMSVADFCQVFCVTF